MQSILGGHSQRGRPLKLLQDVLALLAFTVMSAASAQTVVATSDVVQVSAMVGRPALLTSRVRNLADVDISLEVRAELPQGWRLLTPLPAVTLQGGDEQIVLVPVVVPAHATAGPYSVTTRFLDSNGTVASVRHQIRIEEHHQLSLSLLRGPSIVVTSDFEVSFLLRNLGNVAEEVRLRVSARPESFEATLVSDGGYIHPGEAREVRVSVSPPSDLQRPVRLAVAIEATDDEGGVLASSGTIVEVAAIEQQVDLAYRSLDLTLRTEFSFENDARYGTNEFPEAASVQLFGSGSLLSDDDDLRLSLEADVVDGGLSGLVEYRTDDRRLRFGEQDIAATQLLPAASGFGVAVSIPGGHWRRPREHAFAVVGEEIVAGIEVNEDVTEDLGISFATRMRPGSAQTISGLRIHLENEAKEELIVTAHQGLDMGSLATGFEVALRAEGPAYDIAADWSYTAAGYASRPNARHVVGTEFSVRSVTGPPLEAKGGLRQQLEISEGIDRSAFIELGGSGTNASWSVRYLYSGDLDETSPFVKQDLRLSSRLESNDVLDLRSELWWKRVDHLSIGRFEEVVGTSLAVEIPVFRGTLASGFELEYELEEKQLAQVDLNLGWQSVLAERTKWGIFGTLGMVGDEQLELWTTGVHLLESGARIGFSGNAVLTVSGLQQLEAEMGISLPFRLNVAKRSNVGEVVGTIVDSRGQGVSGIVVWLAGFTSVTRADGSFSFPAIPAGRHVVTLHGVEAGTVVTPSLPHVVHVEAGKVHPINLRIFAASQIAAGFSVRDPSLGNSKEDDGTVIGSGEAVADADLLAGLVLELDGPGGTQRQIVGPTGDVRFTHLQPGEWTIGVVGASVPEYYRVEPLSQTIELAEGTTEKVSFELVPVVRRIDFQDGGVVGN